METKTNQRLESLDALRGFDLFFLFCLGPIFHSLKDVINQPWYDSFLWFFSHEEWRGFSSWDLIMPLFMFMAGVSLPFSLTKYRDLPDKTAVHKRILRRVVLLWIFGMMCQGNLLGLDPGRIFFYSNTLQSIAMGYLIAAILFLHTRPRTQVIVSVALLLIYWAAMQFITVGNYGGGNYTPDANLAEWIDRVVLGRFRDGSKVIDGEVVFGDSYRYTWLLSSLTFGVTVVSGLFAGEILRKDSFTKEKKAKLLLIIGAALVIIGWAWNFELPVIKKIWTSSMTLVSSGYSFLLMGIFYWIIDCRGHRHTTFLRVFGMNSIATYMIGEIIHFDSVSQSVLHGTEQYLGAFYPSLIVVANAAFLFLILYFLHKYKIFLRV